MEVMMMNGPVVNERIDQAALPGRCVIVLDAELPGGRAANAAAVIAMTLGARYPHLLGEDFRDGSGLTHPGLTRFGIPVLAAGQVELAEIRRKGLEAGCDVVDFPLEGQRTNDYVEFQARIAQIPPQELRYAGLALCGSKKAVARIVGRLPLLGAG